MSEEPRYIYIIEDEEDIAKLMQYNLTLAGYKVGCSAGGKEGLAAVEKEQPDLLLLDLMLPGLDGLEICRRLKSGKETTQIPVIMVTAKGEESDIVKGLELGADDYITKPFSPQVLLARVKAVLRRLKAEAAGKGEVIQVGELTIHLGKHEVSVLGKKVELTHSEFQILSFLAQRPGWVYTRLQIVDAIRGENYAVTDRTIDFQMVGLRKKLGRMGESIETVRGVGYRFKG